MNRNSPQKQDYEYWNCSDIIEGREPEKMMNDSYGHHILNRDLHEEDFSHSIYDQKLNSPERKISSEIISTYPSVEQPLTEEEEKYLNSHMCHLSKEQYLRSIIKGFYE